MASRFTPMLAATVIVGLAPGGGAKKPSFMIYQPDNMVLMWPEEPPRPPGSDEGPTWVDHLTHMNRIRDEGVVFTRAYSSSTMCTPSRFSVVTGRYPSRSVSGQYSTLNDCNVDGLEPGASTITHVSMDNALVDEGIDAEKNIATALKALDSDYRTGTFGKWHISAYEDEERKVEYYEAQVAKTKSANFDVAGGFYIGNFNEASFADDYGYSHNLEWMVAEIIDFFDACVEADRPFFAYVNPTAPHEPSITAALKLVDVTKTPSGTLPEAPVTTMTTRENVDALIDTYGSDALGDLWVDDAFGALYQWLDDNSVLEETLLVVTMDHGEGVTNAMVEHATRIALFVRYPLFPKGTSVDGLVSGVDYLPTFFDIAAQPTCSSSSDDRTLDFFVDGKSWKGLACRNDGAEGHETVFQEYIKNRAVVTKEFRLVRRSQESCCGKSTGCGNGDDLYPYSNDYEQLYDLRKTYGTSPGPDDAELINLAGRSKFQSMLDKLNGELDLHLESTKPVAATTTPLSTPAPTSTTPAATPLPPAGPSYAFHQEGMCETQGKNVEDFDTCAQQCLDDDKCNFFCENADTKECKHYAKCRVTKTTGWTTYKKTSRRLQGLPQTRGATPELFE